MTKQENTRSSRGLILFMLLVQLFAFGLFAGPQVAHQDRQKYCVSNITIGHGLMLGMNCDSMDFLKEANDLSLVTGPQSRRQDRPGTILFAHFLSQPAVILLNKLGANEKTVIVNKTGKIKTAEYAARYVAFLILNMLVLCLSCGLYLRAAGIDPAKSGTFTHAAAFLGLAVFINNVTKQFLWSPHTQIFSILGALAAVCFFKALQETARPRRLFCVLSFLCGAGMLFYGIFVIPATIIGIGWLWRERSGLPGNLPRLAGCGALAVALFALPYALWYAYIIGLNGTFYHYDLGTFMGFSWLPVMLRGQGAHAVIMKLAVNFRDMLAGAVNQGWGFVILLGALMAANRRVGAQTKESRPLWVAAGLYALFTAVFFSFYGMIFLRLSYSLVVPLFPLAGFYLHRLESNAQRPERIFYATLAGMTGYVLFMIAKFGPYS